MSHQALLQLHGEPLAALLYELSLRDDCWYVKLDSFHRTKNGIIRGRCFLTDAEAVAELWTIHKHTDVVTCSSRTIASPIRAVTRATGSPSALASVACDNGAYDGRD